MASIRISLRRRLVRESAEAGHAQQPAPLGLCYDNGEGVARDRAEAMRLYELAASHGYELANYYLALCHEEADEAAQAAALYEPLVQEGYVAAYARMGLLLAEGRGVAQDLARAEELLATCTDYAASFYDDELAQIWRVLADCRQALGGDAREAEDAALALYDSLADSDRERRVCLLGRQASGCARRRQGGLSSLGAGAGSLAGRPAVAARGAGV